jgi:uncharacterized protein
MLTTDWVLSPRQYGLKHDRDIAVPVCSGETLDCDIFRPDAPGKFPVILSVHAYSKSDQTAPLTPIGLAMPIAHIEAGDPNFFVRRGYVHVIMNIRGTGRSSGEFGNLDDRSISEIADAIAWLAAQPWSNGRVGMFGISYFAIVQHRVAALHPPALKCIFAPYGWNDAYRDRYYHGGILSWAFARAWIPTLDNPRFDQTHREALGPERFRAALDNVRNDPELQQVPFLREVMNAADVAHHRLILDFLINQLDGPYYRERSVDFRSDKPSVPAFLGGCWGIYGLHLPGAFRAFDGWHGPKKLMIGPPIYLDRPFYQYQYESLRWFDHWLKDNDTGMMDEEPVRVFIVNTGTWKTSSSWPLPETRWTPFYLHRDGLLSEHEFWADEAPTSFVDSPHERGTASFTTPPMVETTEICGPIVLTLYASTTVNEVLWFVSLLEIDRDGSERLLTRGWLRGSQRRLDPELSKPWQPYHTHDRREPLTPGEIYKFDIEVRPYGIRLDPGKRLKLRIRTCDDERPENDLQAIGLGHLNGATTGVITIHHDTEHPSCLLLPVTAGNLVGTFMSGGALPLTMK